MKLAQWKCPCLIAFVVILSGLASADGALAADPTVFDSVPATVTPVIRAGVPLATGPMRTLTIAERVGVARVAELVRVPLFFHAGECNDPNGLTIYDLADPVKTPIAYQADDIRKAQTGEIARMHVYFYADLKPWERKQFGVIKGTNPATGTLAMTEAGDGVTFKGEDITVGFIVKGPKAGAITQLETSFGKLNLMDGFIAPEFRLVRQDPKCKEIRTTKIGYDKPEGFEVRELKYASGPLFGKLRVKIGPVGLPDSAETTYLIPKTGSYIVITQRTFAEDQDSGDAVGSIWPEFLKGRVTFGPGDETATTTKISTGLRKLIREAQNQTVEAEIAQKSGFSVINIPPISAGGEIHYQVNDPLPERLDEKGKSQKADPPKYTLSIMGPGTLKRTPDANSGTLRAFWVQSRVVFSHTTDVETLWDQVRTGQNSLVAVVDEPGVTIDDLAGNFKEIGQLFYKIKYWGKQWYQDIALEYLTGNEEAMKKHLANQANTPKPSKRADDATIEAWAPQWARDQFEAAGNKPPIKIEKGVQLDKISTAPYNIGYMMSGLVPLTKYAGPSDRMDKICDSIARASMMINGGVTKEGMPRINAFSDAFNMQIGSIFFGVYSGKKLDDPWMTMFYRDIPKGSGAACIYGHGERCYSGDIRNGEQSDSLYQAISDNWLRCIELVCNENMSVHPAIYSRYTDDMDVTADLQHRSLSPTGTSNAMANFFRGQSHDHRWESWDVMPYIILQENADEDVPTGLTDAVYFARDEINWMKANDRTPSHAQLLQYFHPLFNLRVSRLTYKPPVLPPLPGDVKSSAADGGVRVTWSKVENAVGYRVYRSERIGKPLTFLNSPYTPDKRGELVKETSYVDAAGSPEMFYFVTAVDKDGNESDWFPDEPTPHEGKNAK